MTILYTATDADGTTLVAHTIIAGSWREACARGMAYRNELVKSGITVAWRKA